MTFSGVVVRTEAKKFTLHCYVCKGYKYIYPVNAVTSSRGFTCDSCGNTLIFHKHEIVLKNLFLTSVYKSSDDEKKIGDKAEQYLKSVGYIFTNESRLENVKDSLSKMRACYLLNMSDQSCYWKSFNYLKNKILYLEENVNTTRTHLTNGVNSPESEINSFLDHMVRSMSLNMNAFIYNQISDTDYEENGIHRISVYARKLVFI